MKSEHKASHISCENCSLRPLCLPVGLDFQGIDALDSIITEKRIVSENELLLKINDPFKYIFAVRSGCFKAYNINENGDEQVLGFYFPGELIGFEAIAEQRFPYTIIALETSGICVIPYDKLFELASKLPTLQKQLMHLMSQRITTEATINPNTGAQERVAIFLLSLSQRFKRRGYSATEFNFPMSRDDMGNYLGLATETISRVLKKLVEKNTLEINRRSVKLKDINKMQGLICHKLAWLNNS